MKVKEIVIINEKIPDVNKLPCCGQKGAVIKVDTGVFYHPQCGSLICTKYAYKKLRKKIGRK